MRGSHWPGEPLSASSDNNPDVQRLVLAGQQHIADIMDPETFSKHLLGFLHGPTLHREPCAIVEVEPPVIRAIANPDQDRPFTITSDQLWAQTRRREPDLNTAPAVRESVATTGP
jgi:hypothetical protein